MNKAWRNKSSIHAGTSKLELEDRRYLIEHEVLYVQIFFLYKPPITPATATPTTATPIT